MQKRYKREKASIDIIKKDIGIFFQDKDIKEDIFHDIRLSVIELVSNIIKYSKSEDKFTILFENNAENAIITLVYTDNEFITPESKFRDDQMQESGLGVYLVSNLMDRLDYFYDEKTKEVEVRIEKRTGS